MGWTHDGQLDRFDAVLDELDPQPGDRLLDYGCGTGRLTEFLSPGVNYVGYDTAPGMVDRAHRDHPDRRFQDWLPATGDFDLVCAIGPFNLPDRWSKEMTWYMLRRLWARTTRRLVASLYAGTDEGCLVYTLDECERFAHAETFYGRAFQWRCNDILIVLERPA
ncbi:MAG TPA: methyltransferase domain-containing protein [Acidimicrobiales bacterium]|nr:methyltransferase domain-containing protein [Acidimicrobiales bacterium]